MCSRTLSPKWQLRGKVRRVDSHCGRAETFQLRKRSIFICKTYVPKRPRSQHVWALWMLKSATRALIVTFFVATVRVNSPNFTSQLSFWWKCSTALFTCWGGVRLKVTTGSKRIFIPTPGREVLKSFPIHFCNIDIAKWDKPRITELDIKDGVSKIQF